MLSKKITITTTQLDTHEVVSGIVFIETMESGVIGGPVYTSLYPKGIQIKNETAISVGFTLIASDEEFNDYVEDDTNFDLIVLADHEAINFTDWYPIPRAKYLIVKGVASSSDTDLDIYFINYV